MKRPRARTGVPIDTAAEAYDVQIEAYRRLGGAGRTAVMFRLNEAARQNALAGIRERHPDYTEEQGRMALARLLLGDDLFRRAWPTRALLEP